MSKSERLPKLQISDDVRPEHGNAFADELLRCSAEGLTFVDAFDETHLIAWPMLADDTDDEPAQRRYDAIAKEISGRVLAEVKSHIVEAFVRIATDVLDRERER